jgi:hypothetical protein
VRFPELPQAREPGGVITLGSWPSSQGKTPDEVGYVVLYASPSPRRRVRAEPVELVAARSGSSSR